MLEQENNEDMNKKKKKCGKKRSINIEDKKKNTHILIIIDNI